MHSIRQCRVTFCMKIHKRGQVMMNMLILYIFLLVEKDKADLINDVINYRPHHSRMTYGTQISSPLVLAGCGNK